MHERSFVVLEGVIDMGFLYPLVNAGALTFWLSCVYVFFANRRHLHQALQAATDRQPARLAFSTVLLLATTHVPLFFSWTNPVAKLWVIPVWIVGMIGFTLIRSKGESVANSVSRKVTRDLANTGY